MDYQEAIKELESLNKHCCDMIDKEDKESIWIKDCEALNVAISAIQELQEYKQIGDLEELKELSELSKEERPIAVLGTFGGEEYECKNCGSPVEYLDEYCRYCGQKQDWE